MILEIISAAAALFILNLKSSGKVIRKNYKKIIVWLYFPSGKILLYPVKSFA